MRKTTDERITSVDEQIRHLENEKKQLLQKKKADDRKERTSRLCRRGGAVEKLFPELAAITDEQFDIFVKKVLLSDYTKRVIADLQAQKTAPKVETKPAEAVKIAE